VAINSSPFMLVKSAGYSIAASDSHLYACYGGLGAFATLARSSDGVDWADDPAGINNVGTLVEGDTHIVLTGGYSPGGGFPDIINTRVLAKNSTTWSTIAAITDITKGGRYIGGRYFAFADTKLYHSQNAVDWSSVEIPFTISDVGYDGSHYLILANGLETQWRLYKTTDFSSFSAVPLPFRGVSIYFLDGTYWISGYTGLAPTIIYRSTDLYTFTATWYSPGGIYALLSAVDNTLVFGGGNTVIPQNKGYYYYDSHTPGYTQSLISASDYTDNPGRLGLCMKHQVVIKNGYVYLSGGSIHRAVYNAAWRDVVPAPVLTLNQLESGVIDTPYSSGTLGTIAGGKAPFTWSGSVFNPGGASVHSFLTNYFTFTPTALGTYSYIVTVVDSNGTSDQKTGTFLVSDGSGTTGLVLVTNVLPGATVNKPYSAPVGGISGGAAPYTWAIVSKSWAGEATISNMGILSTTFIELGNETLTVSVTDSSTPQQSLSREVAVTVGESVHIAIIQGTLRLDTSDGEFAARKVYLFDYTTGAKVAETTSDGTTGVWQFAQVAPGEYFVVGAAQGDDLNIPRDFDAMGVITIN
jgi:hypothetical protein